MSLLNESIANTIFFLFFFSSVDDRSLINASMPTANLSIGRRRLQTKMAKNEDRQEGVEEKKFYLAM